MPADIRKISDHLYISDPEQRLLQEIVLGIGGSEMLRALGIEHSILHMNEGHPAFAQLERLRERVVAGMEFEAALKDVKATSIFTTHTPVPAGHDFFPLDLMDKYFGNYYPQLHLSREAFYDLGKAPFAAAAGFNMTAFALRMSNYRNGVSRKHGEVARRMWQPIWPDKPVAEVPIDSITNGVHVPTWIEPKMEMLLNQYLGPDWLARHDDPKTWEAVASIPGPGTLAGALLAEGETDRSHQGGGAPALGGRAGRLHCAGGGDPPGPHRPDPRIRPPVCHLQAG